MFSQIGRTENKSYQTIELSLQLTNHILQVLVSISDAVCVDWEWSKVLTGYWVDTTEQHCLSVVSSTLSRAPSTLLTALRATNATGVKCWPNVTARTACWWQLCFSRVVVRHALALCKNAWTLEFKYDVARGHQDQLSGSAEGQAGSLVENSSRTLQVKWQCVECWGEFEAKWLRGWKCPSWSKETVLVSPLRINSAVSELELWHLL